MLLTAILIKLTFFSLVRIYFCSENTEIDTETTKKCSMCKQIILSRKCSFFMQKNMVVCHKCAQKRIVSLYVALIIVSNTSGSLLVKAQCNSDNGVDREKMIECLVDNGYAQETAEALDERKLEEIYSYILDGIMMDVSTCAMEVDTLSEIENYLSCTEEELQDFGLTEEEIASCDEQLSDLLSMSNKELKQNFSLSNTEVKVLRLAEENGIENRENNIVDNKKISNEVCASGALTSSDIKYTQSVANQSTSKKPKYVVNLSYAWKYVYLYGYMINVKQVVV